MAILRKELIKTPKKYPNAQPQIDGDGKLIAAGDPYGVYDVLCDQIADLVADDTLAVGSMAYVREEVYHVQVKVADAGAATDWGALSNISDSDDSDDDTEEAEES